MCAKYRRDIERGSYTREKREQPRGSCLEKKKTSKRERVVRGEENREERAKYCHL